MSIPQIDGPRIPPASGTAKKLVIFAHGYGADGNDLIGIGQQLQPIFPDVAFVSPNAPERPPGAPFGYQWFPITRLDPDEYWKGVQAAAPVLDQFIDQELVRWNLTIADLALVGFSQGTMMSLHVGLRRAEQLAGIVGFSGALAGPEHLASEIKSKPPVLLVHGEADEMIPVQAIHLASQALGSVGVSVQWHVSPGIGHGIDGEGLMLAAKFLQGVFAPGS